MWLASSQGLIRLRWADASYHNKAWGEQMETLDAGERRANYPLIPPLILQTLERWDSGTIHGEPCSFIQAVLKNDLMTAITRGDADTIRGIRDIVLFCVMELPSPAWGSPASYDAWLARIRRFQAQAFNCASCGHTEDKHAGNTRCCDGGCGCRKFQMLTIHDVE